MYHSQRIWASPSITQSSHFIHCHSAPIEIPSCWCQNVLTINTRQGLTIAPCGQFRTSKAYVVFHNLVGRILSSLDNLCFLWVVRLRGLDIRYYTGVEGSGDKINKFTIYDYILFTICASVSQVHSWDLNKFLKTTLLAEYGCLSPSYPLSIHISSLECLWFNWSP